MTDVNLGEQFQEECGKFGLRNFQLRMEIKEGVLILLGEVRTYHQKQVATAIASRLADKSFQIDSQIIVG
jgi:hypothetical protein